MNGFYKKYMILIWGILTGPLSACAQLTEPLLRLETGMHNARSGSISSNAQGNYLVTCSDDKTARLWDALTGKLVNILRIPIEEINTVKLYACALSPDTKMVAVGGQTGITDEHECIFVMDPFTGEIIKSLCNLPNVINRLEFSPDGKWLAAGLGSDGIRIYDTQTWEQKELTGDYKGAVYGINFSTHGQFVTACFDGYIRLYKVPEFTFEARTNVLKGDAPYSVNFNAAGDLIAVGYDDQPIAEVLHSNKLLRAYSPDVSGLPSNVSISSVCFSKEGNTLYAGGSYFKPDAYGNKKYVLRKWENGGKGTQRDFPLLENSITDLKPLPGGNIALTGSYPDVGVYTPKGMAFWYKKADNLNFGLNKQEDFKLSLDGDAINVTADYGEPVFFKLANRSLSQDNALYYSPLTQTARVKLTEFIATKEPSINNQKVHFLAEDERCQSACLNKNGTWIAWGTNYALYLTDNSGRVIWKQPLPEVAFAVNIAAHNKTVTVALGDGTIRWYGLEYGNEVLSLYISTNRKHWILYSPDGYYDASPGSEKLLGWHVNNGLDQAPSFFPASSFKQGYYRPDIIDAIIENWDEDKAIYSANESNSSYNTPQRLTKENIPPVIVINNPRSGTEVNSSKVTINYSVSTPQSAPVKGGIKVFVDGRPVQEPTASRGLGLSKNGNYNIDVNISGRSCTVTLLAENKYGMSAEANLYLKYNDSLKNDKKPDLKATLNILAIGVSDYANPAYRLKYAADDAISFSKAFKKQEGLLYENVFVECLTDKKATRENIEDKLEWIKTKTTDKDIAMIFFAGHGINDKSNFFYMAPVGADAKNLLRTCVNFATLAQTIASIPGKVVVFIDACHSGNVMGSGKFSVDINRAVNELTRSENGAVVFASSTSREFSLEDDEWKHGAFTKALLDGLNGEALFGEGETEITIKSLDLYISRTVKRLTNEKQHPKATSATNVPDFTISIVNK